MKLKKIIVQKFVHKDEFGENVFSSVEIMFDPSVNEITPDTFDQDSQEFFLSDSEINRLTRDSAQRFFNAVNSDVLSGKRFLSSRELNGIRLLFDVNGAELGDLIGLEKSSISRILKGEGKQFLQKDKSMLLMERLKDELECVGSVKSILEHIKPKNVSEELVIKNVSAMSIAEIIIRTFDAMDESITLMKLQKLLYYAQGIAFGRHNTKLIKEPFLAWEHGPVVREVWDSYPHGKDPLKANLKLDLTSLEKDETLMKVIKETISSYGRYTAWVLRNNTHNESPWVETPKNEVITDEKFLSFFKKAVI